MVEEEGLPVGVDAGKLLLIPLPQTRLDALQSPARRRGRRGPVMETWETHEAQGYEESQDEQIDQLGGEHRE